MFRKTAALCFIVCFSTGIFCTQNEPVAAPVEPTSDAVILPQPVPAPEEAPEPNSKSFGVVVTYPVPLNQDLQDFIVRLCEEQHIDPCIVFAVIERESTYNSDAIGDNGRSFGLMQVQKRWHEDRMERLGVTDLLNPYQNVTVGVDYLAEMIGKGNGVEWALRAYNAGPTNAYRGGGTTYAKAVLEISETIAEGVNERVLQ